MHVSLGSSIAFPVACVVTEERAPPCTGELPAGLEDVHERSQGYCACAPLGGPHAHAVRSRPRVLPSQVRGDVCERRLGDRDGEVELLNNNIRSTMVNASSTLAAPLPTVVCRLNERSTMRANQSVILTLVSPQPVCGSPRRRCRVRVLELLVFGAMVSSVAILAQVTHTSIFCIARAPACRSRAQEAQ